MSSLIPADLLQNKRKLHQNDGPSPEGVKSSVIRHPETFLSQAKSYLEDEKISHGDRQRAIKGRFRDWLLFERIPVAGVTGHVDASGFGRILRASTNGMLKTIKTSQNNGDWRVLDAEAQFLSDSSGEEHIILGVRWVDMKNSEPLGYREGHPANSITIKNSLPPELLEKLSASPDAELKDLVKQLVMGLAVLAANAAGGAKSAAATNPAADE
jgi:hypothetical protein